MKSGEDNVGAVLAAFPVELMAGQVKTAQMAAYPGFAITKSGRAKLNEVDRKEAERTGQVDGMENDPISLVKDGRIHYRNIPVQQTLEDWNDFWSEYKNA